jgi:hypothetical protein
MDVKKEEVKNLPKSSEVQKMFKPLVEGTDVKKEDVVNIMTKAGKRGTTK